MQKFCKDKDKGKEDCIKHSEQACEFAKKQLEKCQGDTSVEKVTEIVKRKVHEMCVFKAIKDKTAGVNQKYWAPINGLDQAQQQMQGTEYSSWIGGEKSKLMSVGEEVTTLETQEKQKDFIYQITKMLGMQAQREKEEATKLKEQTEKLNQTIESLKSIIEQVDDATLKATLSAQITELENRRNELQKTVSDKEASLYGFFTSLAKMFGGGQ